VVAGVAAVGLGAYLQVGSSGSHPPLVAIAAVVVAVVAVIALVEKTGLEAGSCRRMCSGVAHSPTRDGEARMPGRLTSVGQVLLEPRRRSAPSSAPWHRAWRSLLVIAGVDYVIGYEIPLTVIYSWPVFPRDLERRSPLRGAPFFSRAIPRQ